MKYRSYWIASIIICIILISITVAWSYGKIWSLTSNGLMFVWFIGLIWLDIIVNQTIIEDKLVMEDKLLSYPRYRLALAGAGVIACMMWFEWPANRLIWSIAAASICLWRDHRWSAFLALDMLVMVIVSLLIKEQWLADLLAIYLYYFLVIATVTMVMNNKWEDLDPQN